MTDNNWITPEWIDKKYEEWASGVECKYDSCTICKKSGETQSCETYNDFFANEINKKIQNILESAEKRDCETCVNDPWCYHRVQIRQKELTASGCVHIVGTQITCCSLYTKKG